MSAQKSLMSAVVELRPDIDEKAFKKSVQAAVSKSEKDMVDGLSKAGKKAGDKAGKNIGDGIESGTKKGTDGAAKTMDTAGGKFTGAFSKMKSVGMGMTVGITAPLALLGKGALDTFSQLQDAQAAAGVFYGDQVSKIDGWAATAASSFGVSKRAAYELANGLAPLVSQFASVNERGNVTVEMMSRAADMSSFFGGSVDEAAGAVQSFLSGSSVEPIRRYGVFASEAAIASKALDMGLVKASGSTAQLSKAQIALREAQANATAVMKDASATNLEKEKAANAVAVAEENLAKVMEGKVPALTEAQKIEARYALLMESTNQAAGDYARTSDSLANSQKTASAEFENARSALGEKLAPVMVKVLDVVTKLMDKFMSLPEPIQNAILIIAGIAAVLGPLLVVVGALGPVITAVTAAVGGLSAAFAFLAANPIVLAIAAIVIALAAIGYVIYRNWDTIKAFLGSVWDGFKRLGNVLTEPFKKLWDVAQKVFGFIVGAVKGIANTYLTAYEKIINGFIWGINKLIDGVNIVNPFSDVPYVPTVKLPRLATGGTTTAPGTVMVGEEGPELLKLPRAASVVPLDHPAADQALNTGSTDPARMDRLAAAIDRLASQPRTINVTVQGGNFDERRLAQELDRLSREANAKTGRTRRPRT